MKRRDFLGGMGLAAAGSLMTSDSANAKTNQRIEFAKGPSDRPLEIQIAVKPVYSPLIHSDVWEGPCRPSAGSKSQKERADDDLAAMWSMANARTPEQERADAPDGMKRLVERIKANPNPDIRLLDPVLLEYSEDFWFPPEKLAQLEPDRDKVDVYLVGGTHVPNYTATVIAETFKKPIVMGGGFGARDAVAYLKARGLEGHAVFNQELNPLLSLLKTRKVFQQTSILIVTDRGLPPIPIRSCMDVNMLKDRFGIGSHFVSYREFANEMDKVLKSREWGGKAESRAEQLIKNAEEKIGDSHLIFRWVERRSAIILCATTSSFYDKVSRAARSRHTENALLTHNFNLETVVHTLERDLCSALVS